MWAIEGGASQQRSAAIGTSVCCFLRSFEGADLAVSRRPLLGLRRRVGLLSAGAVGWRLGVVFRSWLGFMVGYGGPWEVERQFGWFGVRRLCSSLVWVRCFTRWLCFRRLRVGAGDGGVLGLVYGG